MPSCPPSCPPSCRECGSRRLDYRNLSKSQARRFRNRAVDVAEITASFVDPFSRTISDVTLVLRREGKALVPVLDAAQTAWLQKDELERMTGRDAAIRHVRIEQPGTMKPILAIVTDESPPPARPIKNCPGFELPVCGIVHGKRAFVYVMVERSGVDPFASSFPSHTTRKHLKWAAPPGLDGKVTVECDEDWVPDEESDEEGADEGGRVVGKPRRARCVGCEEAKAYSKCDRCLIARYCSRECQVADWSRHKAGCRPQFVTCA